ncbi:MAG: diacylglycerol/lipid kinase family protein [Bacteroidota bacterium]
MEKQRIVFIINPISGRRRKPNLPAKIYDLLDRQRYVPGIVYTEYAGHAKELASGAIANGIRFVVAVGGDGTVNEVGSAVRDTEAALGIIPIGSGNGLARHMQIPLTINGALEVINKGVVQRIDYGLLNGAPFFCTAGFGFDAKVGHVFAKAGQRGFITYAQTVLKEYGTYSTKKYMIKLDGEKIKRKAFLLTIANASQFGNNAFVSPNAIIDDGLLDVTVVSPFPRRNALDIGLRLFRRNLDKSQFTEVFTACRITIQRKKKLMAHMDGEPVMIKKKAKIRVVPGGLKIIVPDK